MKQWEAWGIMIHPEDRDAASIQANNFLQGRDSEIEYRLIKANGEIIWARDNGRVRRDIITNNPIVYGVVSNITYRKQVETAIQQQRDFLQQVVDINPHFIFAKDRDGRFTLANKAFSRAYGTTVDHLIGKTEAEVNANRILVERYNQEDFGVIESGKELVIPEDKIVNNYGQARWRSTVKRPISDETGRTYQVLGVSTDITALKVTEQNLARALDTAQEINQFKTQLLANVSHDLRTPLNAILGHTEMLQKGIYGPLTERQLKITERVINNTKNLTAMVNRLVDQARLEAGTLMLEIAPFNPANLLAQMHFTMDILAETKHLSLTSSMADNIPDTLYSDFDQLIQILQNLVGNAIKFTDQGTVHVRLFCPSPYEWGLEVTDTGPGIPAEAQAYIFEAFRQVDGTATRRHGGSGLGLSIVKQLVTMMAGTVSVQSQLEQGSTFRVVFPINTPEEPAP
jgi:PAS domain S-box-containing protein